MHWSNFYERAKFYRIISRFRIYIEGNHASCEVLMKRQEKLATRIALTFDQIATK